MHIPVLLEKVIYFLDPAREGVYCDCTIGAGGHAASILTTLTGNSRLIGIDQDPAALALCHQKFKAEVSSGKLTLLHGNFAHIASRLKSLQISQVNGFLLDLGVSSLQLDSPARGFSFQMDGPLDMRMDPGQVKTALDLIGELTEKELAEVICRYGEEPAGKRISKGIQAALKKGILKTTRDLVRVIESAKGHLGGHRRISPATKTFQAIRIALNRELDSLSGFFSTGLDFLVQGGRLVIIAFHSLEDRLAKQFFKRETLRCICPPDMPVCGCHQKPRLKILTRHPVVPEEGELLLNPRSRSAKLRAAEKIG